MYEGETERIPRVTDRGEPDLRGEPGLRDDLRAEPGPSAHHHAHGPPPPASRRVRKLLALLLVPFALAAVVGTVLLFPFGDGPQTDGGAGRPVDGVITATETGPCNGGVQVGEQPDAPQCLVVRIRMTDGEAPGHEISVIVPQEPSTPRFAVDDEVVLSYGGSDPRQSSSYQLVDFQRDLPLALLAGWFAVAILVMGRWQGLRALVGLGLSLLVLVFFVLPAILAGENPLLVAICGSGVIMFAVLFLTHGFSARTATAVLGTMVSLAMIGVLGTLWAALTNLTGLDEDTATLVGLLNAPIDTRGLLLAGVVIGALGVLDDVTVTQTSAVWELRAANPLLTRRQLYGSALRIGRDHVASAVNTLVMAYAGAALPLLLYSSISGVGLGSVLTSQSIAQELVRTLVGSIGLVAAVPITTALATAVASKEPLPESVRRGRAPRKKDRAAGKPGEPVGREAERSEGRPLRNGERAARAARAERNGHGNGPAPWSTGTGGRAPHEPGRPGRRFVGDGQPPGRGDTSLVRGDTGSGRANTNWGRAVTGRADPGSDRTDTSVGRAGTATGPTDTGSGRGGTGLGRMARRPGPAEPADRYGVRAVRGRDDPPGAAGGGGGDAMRTSRRMARVDPPGRVGGGEGRDVPPDPHVNGGTGVNGVNGLNGGAQRPSVRPDWPARAPARGQGQWTSWFDDDLDG